MEGRLLSDLFLTFAKVGAFTFGGGYAMIPLIQREVVDQKKWISNEDILDVIAIAESTPGPIAINSATFIGKKVAGPDHHRRILCAGSVSAHQSRPVRLLGNPGRRSCIDPESPVVNVFRL